MIVVAIIGILAAIAVPKFAELIRKSNEGATKGSMGAVRSALSIYYADNEGQYPSDDLSSLAVSGKYLSAMPSVLAPNYHPNSAIVENNDDWGMGSMAFTDDGRWLYWNWTMGLSPRGKGDIWLACTHTDTKGNRWTTY
ncbi:MAG: hypothetical protein COV48_07310 [Elusimicrobia bacterium CG11_big_fil_rev_8_21_14_0_20_64_6]|nr:MAG: hypothetical protein COV48_07310 [Elusimicrobia bacterium CG11_big_fil_rev_8_21_14_0_20_64_6]